MSKRFWPTILLNGPDGDGDFALIMMSSRGQTHYRYLSDKDLKVLIRVLKDPQ